MPLPGRPRNSEDDSYHWVYRTGPHDPVKKDISTEPVLHASCNSCLTDLTAATREELDAQLEQHKSDHFEDFLEEHVDETVDLGTRGGDAFQDLRRVGTVQNLPKIPPRA